MFKCFAVLGIGCDKHSGSHHRHHRPGHGYASGARFSTDDRAAFDDGWETLENAEPRLPWEVAPLFRQWLQLHYPQRADRVMARIHDMRGGKDYNADFATRMQGSGLWADLLGQRFHKICAKLGLNRERVELDVAQFRPGLLSGQGSLF